MGTADRSADWLLKVSALGSQVGHRSGLANGRCLSEHCQLRTLSDTPQGLPHRTTLCRCVDLFHTHCLMTRAKASTCLPPAFEPLTANAGSQPLPRGAWRLFTLCKSALCGLVCVAMHLFCTRHNSMGSADLSCTVDVPRNAVETVCTAAVMPHGTLHRNGMLCSGWTLAHRHGGRKATACIGRVAACVPLIWKKCCGVAQYM